jgi:hypothetical protein
MIPKAAIKSSSIASDRLLRIAGRLSVIRAMPSPASRRRTGLSVDLVAASATAFTWPILILCQAGRCAEDACARLVPQVIRLGVVGKTQADWILAFAD